jgi:hypothetical protein
MTAESPPPVTLEEAATILGAGATAARAYEGARGVLSTALDAMATEATRLAAMRHQARREEIRAQPAPPAPQA